MLSKSPSGLLPTERAALVEEKMRREGLLRPHVKKDVVQERRLHTFMNELQPMQLAFVKSPRKLKAAQCGRRAGKTFATVFAALETAHSYPGEVIPYITTSRNHAKLLFWKPLKEYNAKYQLGMTFNETELTATLTNGATIWLSGAKDADDTDKFRGGRYPLVILDELASFKGHIETLIEDSLMPALGDFDGTMMAVGSPGIVPAGMFFDITTGKKAGWEVFKWNMRQNAMFPQWAGKPDWQERCERYVQTLKERLGEDSPKFQREVLGEWVEDGTGQVYKYTRGANTYRGTLPENIEWNYVLGIDFGYDPDPMAFSVGAFSYQSPDFYVCETYCQTKMLDSAINAKIDEFEKKYGAFVATVGDAASKHMIAQINERYSRNIVPAEKADKFEYIEIMNSDFICGRIKVREGDPLEDEYVRLVYDPDTHKEHPRRPNHAADATLYAWRKSRHWAGKTPESPKFLPGSVDFEAHKFKAWLNKLAKEAVEEARGENNDGSSAWSSFLDRQFD